MSADNQPAPLASPPPPDPGTALRRARQCARLDRLGEMAMELAELNAAIAKRELTKPPPQPASEPAAPAPQAAASEAMRNFARMADIVRHVTALEASIAEGRPSPLADPRRAVIRRALRAAIAADPDPSRRTRIRREIDAVLDRELENDPGGTIEVREIFTLVAADFKLALPQPTPASRGPP